MSRDGPDEAQKRVDNNRARELQARRLLGQLLAEACAAGFSGTISLEVSAKCGYLARPKTTRVAFHEGD